MKEAVRKGLPGGSFKPMTEEGLRMMHEKVMRTIEEVGFLVHTDEGLELFKGAGASVDEETRLVRMPPVVRCSSHKRSAVRVKKSYT